MESLAKAHRHVCIYSSIWKEVHSIALPGSRASNGISIEENVTNITSYAVLTSANPLLLKQSSSLAKKIYTILGADKEEISAPNISQLVSWGKHCLNIPTPAGYIEAGISFLEVGRITLDRERYKMDTGKGCGYRIYHVGWRLEIYYICELKQRCLLDHSCFAVLFYHVLSHTPNFTVKKHPLKAWLDSPPWE